jgi:hypothetical protein
MIATRKMPLTGVTVELVATTAVEAIVLVQSKRSSDECWLLETRYLGMMPVEMNEGEGRPRRWNTLRTLRVLVWYSAEKSSSMV